MQCATCYTHVNLWPETGRTHQLRKHCKAIGHPILGDQLYGLGSAPGAPGLGVSGTNQSTPGACNPQKMYLYACGLTFRHPLNLEKDIDSSTLTPKTVDVQVEMEKEYDELTAWVQDGKKRRLERVH